MKSGDLSEVRKWRRAFGLRQAWLAKQTGITRWKISRWESGKLDLTDAEVETVKNAIGAVVQERANAHTLPGRDTSLTDSAARAKAIAITRRTYAITQADLARAVGSTPDVVSLVENGYAELTSEELAAWQKALYALVEKRMAGAPKTIPLASLAKISLADPGFRISPSPEDRIRQFEKLVDSYETAVRVRDRLIASYAERDIIQKELIQAYADGVQELTAENSGLRKSLKDKEDHIKELRELLGLETDAVVSRDEADTLRGRIQ